MCKNKHSVLSQHISNHSLIEWIKLKSFVGEWSFSGLKLAITSLTKQSTIIAQFSQYLYALWLKTQLVHGTHTHTHSIFPSISSIKLLHQLPMEPVVQSTFLHNGFLVYAKFTIHNGDLVKSNLALLEIIPTPMHVLAVFQIHYPGMQHLNQFQFELCRFPYIFFVRIRERTKGMYPCQMVVKTETYYLKHNLFGV